VTSDLGHDGAFPGAVHTREPVYSARVGLGYRALAVRDGDVVIWFWIGSHAECDRILANR
jgi:hypothetical protein